MKVFTGLQHIIMTADTARNERTPRASFKILREISGLIEGDVYSIEETGLRNCFREEDILAEENITDKLTIWLTFFERSRQVLYFIKNGIYYFYRDIAEH